MKERKIWWTVNKCDENGNIITGYQEDLWGTKKQVESDYRAYHEYNGHIDFEPMLAETE